VGGGRNYAVVSPDRAFAIFATEYLRALLEKERRENNAVLLFSMVCHGKLPPAKPGSYLLLG
jgi:hypothetical protein